MLATDDPNQRKSMHYIGSCIGRAAYLLDKAESFSRDKDKGRYNVFLLNGINDRNAARENARRRPSLRSTTSSAPTGCWTSS